MRVEFLNLWRGYYSYSGSRPFTLISVFTEMGYISLVLFNFSFLIDFRRPVTINPLIWMAGFEKGQKEISCVNSNVCQVSEVNERT
jgi:hypothetical protein